MFNIDDYIMYGKTGICQVIGIEKGKLIGDSVVEYYVLRPLNETMTIKTPVNNKKVSMRGLSSKADVLSFIDSIADAQPNWITNDKARFRAYDSKLSGGSCAGWLEIIKAVNLREKDSESGRKNISPRDREISKEARRLLFEEFSVSLGIPEGDVESFIFDRINKK